MEHQVIYYSTNWWIVNLAPSGIPINKPSHVPSCGPSDSPSFSSSVAMSVNTSHFPGIKPTTLSSDVPSEKPIMLVL